MLSESFTQNRTYCVIPFTFHSRTGKINLQWKISEHQLLSGLGQGLTEKGHEGNFWVMIVFYSMIMGIVRQVDATVKTQRQYT